MGATRARSMRQRPSQPRGAAGNADQHTSFSCTSRWGKEQWGGAGCSCLLAGTACATDVVIHSGCKHVVLAPASIIKPQNTPAASNSACCRPPGSGDVSPLPAGQNGRATDMHHLGWQTAVRRRSHMRQIRRCAGAR
jgi:hypothetical protein